MGELYDRIASLCSNKGIKPGKMCNDLGISRGSIGDLKKGRREGISIKTATKIADYFGVTTDYLLTGDETKKAPTDEGERIPHRDKRELLAGRGVSLLLDADAKLTEEQLDDIVNFIQFQQEKNGR